MIAEALAICTTLCFCWCCGLTCLLSLPALRLASDAVEMTRERRIKRSVAEHANCINTAAFACALMAAFQLLTGFITFLVVVFYILYKVI